MTGERATRQQRSGRLAEAAALRFLSAQGLEHLESNYRCRQGEVDLVMRDADGLVFTEVRYRRRSDFGSGAETVGARKQRRLVAAAQHYLQQRVRRERPAARFDVISLSGPLDTPRIEWIRDAFRV